MPIDETDSVLSRLWSPVSHLNSVANSEELREAYESCLHCYLNSALGLVNIKGCMNL
ncbi:oligopeptidase A [Vibrio sp. JCM 19236]|nr:oligopeptidase A [Vibrio sp. JCM 19236]